MKSQNVQFSCQFTVFIKDCKLDTIVSTFLSLQLRLFSIFAMIVLKAAVAQYGELRELLESLGIAVPPSAHLIWKTHGGSNRRISVQTVLGVASIPQLQIKDSSRGGHKYDLCRLLLGLLPLSRISEDAVRRLGVTGALTSFRSSSAILGTVGVRIAHSTIWHCVQKSGQAISYQVDPLALGIGQADGTGVPTNGSGKRGSELKVLIQKNTLEQTARTHSYWRVAGLDIGDYNGGWNGLFEPSLDTIRSFPSFNLMSDGDDSILKGLPDVVNLTIQRCLWHIPHQFIYVLWKDKVVRESPEWKDAMSRIYRIVSTCRLTESTAIDAFVAARREELGRLVALCESKGWSTSAHYLSAAAPNLFTNLQNRLEGKASSYVERVMRTVNTRINYGKWSRAGALNVNKIRLGFYYNGYAADLLE